MAENGNERTPASVPISALLIAAAFAIVVAGPSWASDWQYQRTLTFRSATPRADSVVAVALSTQSLGNPYQHIKADGSDLRFATSDGTTLLNYWIESWNPAEAQ
jgi:hypothetical protein